MKKRKILLGLALAAAAVFSLSACGEETPTEPTTPEVTPDGGGNEAAQNFDVVFKNGDTELTALKQTVKEGESATKPAKASLPTQTGKRFDYWSTDGLTAYNFESAVTKNTTLKAVFADENEYDTLAASDKKIVSTDFYEETIATIPSESFNSNTVKISTTGASDKITSDNKYALNGGELIFDFGDKKITSSSVGVLTVYFELNFAGIKNKEAFFQVNGSSATTTDKEVFGLRVDANGKFAYRIDGGNDMSSNTTVESGKTYKGKVAIDTSDGTASIELNGQKLADVDGLSITDIRGIKFTAKTDGSANKVVDNVAVTFETKQKSELVLAKEAAIATLEGLTLSTNTAIAAAEQAVIDAAKIEVAGATSIEEVNTAKQTALDYVAATKYTLTVKAYTAAATPAIGTVDYVEVFKDTDTVSLKNVSFNGFTVKGLYTADDLATEYTDGGSLSENKVIFAKVEEKSEMKFDAATDLASVAQGATIAKDTVYGDFKVVNGNAKRGNSSAFSLELSTNKQNALQFVVPTGKKANITLVVTSTGKDNTSDGISIFNGTTALANNESTTSAAGTSNTTFTYSNAAAGTYDICSTATNRGFRVVSVTVTLVAA